LFTGDSPFSFSAIDIKTYAMAMLKHPFAISTRQHAKRWFDELPQPHKALDDAIEQGAFSVTSLRKTSNERLKNAKA